ncbi:PH domain-containing protein [Lacinutrix jangbogonensis]|uniref:PH domain-containing protein n=1 Tax=Lacinutrix jangbogonensis TaxID=1469557 RepID=UPI00293508DE|nr:PH domain-containing protein [Lacinutrix jangbogonensis]
MKKIKAAANNAFSSIPPIRSARRECRDVAIKLKKKTLRMKFKSRKDIFFRVFIYGFCVFFIGIIFVRIFFEGKYEFIWTDILLLLVTGLLLWLFFGTEYEITQSELKYKSGPFHGKIELEQIREIIKGKTMWSGMKPATAKNGLIIKYGKYDEIYISPITNDTFVRKILELNNDIKITVN